MVSAINPTKPADNVPASKADLRSNFAVAKREIEALQASQIKNGDPFDMQLSLLTRPTLTWYSERIQQPAVQTNGSVRVRMRNGNVVHLVLTRNVSKLIFEDAPKAGAGATRGRAASFTLIVRQNAAGNHILIWPPSFKWVNGDAPTISSAPNAIDIYAFITIDAGATWFGFVGGQRFA